jgi:hypothetical protein
MAIKGFKQVVEKKGYRLDDKDRKIFEKEIKRGYFGFDVGDIIEFVIYDASDNQLPQEIVQGKKVRYISYTDENIQKYFDKVPENKFNKKSNNAQEYFIDTEKLIKEAGYSNGVFKTQITLLNRRLGSEPRLFDKVWIHEISPSRTEVRVLPVIEDGKSTPNSDLQSRYDTFVNCGTFTADVLIFIDDFINQFDVAEVVKRMLMKKGTISEGQNYIKLIEKEFKLVNFEVYLTQTKSLFTRIVDNYRMNRYYNPFEPNFGQPTGDSFGTEFDIARTFDEICEMASNAAEYSLPKQNIRLNTAKSLGQTKTLDRVDDILLTVRSNDEYESTRPSAQAAQIRGCTDPKAKNYNPNATVSSTCVYDIQVPKYKQIKVCNDKNASNYGKDGTCQYPPPPDPPAPAKPVEQKIVSSSGSGPSTPKTTVSKPSPKLITFGGSNSYSRVGGKRSFYVRVDPNQPYAFDKTNTWSVVGKPGWVTITKGSGDTSSAATQRLNFTIAANTGAARSGDIVVTSKRAGSATFRVNQDAGKSVKVSEPVEQPPKPDPTPPSKPPLTTTPAIIGFSSSGTRIEGPSSIRITTTDSWTASYSGDARIRLSKQSGSGNGSVQVQCNNPNTLGRPINGMVTIRTSNGIVRQTSIYQKEGSSDGGAYVSSGPAGAGRDGISGLSRRNDIER